MKTRLTVEDVMSVSPDINAVVNYIIQDCMHERKMLREYYELSSIHQRDDVIQELMERGFTIRRQDERIFIHWG